LAKTEDQIVDAVGKRWTHDINRKEKQRKMSMNDILGWW